MTKLTNSKHITVVIGVKRANPNGDPDAENMPRQDSNGKGIISSVCLKRKIRNQLQDRMENVLYYNASHSGESERNIKDILLSNPKVKKVFEENTENIEKKRVIASEFTDVRMFGATLAFKEILPKKSLSLGINGVVSVQQAESVEPIMVDSMRITKSLNSEFVEKKSKNKSDTNPESTESGKGSDTMGMQHLVEFGVYKFNMYVPQIMADKLGCSNEDYTLLLDCVKHMFDNDYSEARPAGSMEVLAIVTTDNAEKFSKYELDNMVKISQPEDCDDFGKVIISFEPKKLDNTVVTNKVYSLI